jgi:hypothetical protein
MVLVVQREGSSAVSSIIVGDELGMFLAKGLERQ